MVGVAGGRTKAREAEHRATCRLYIFSGPAPRSKAEQLPLFSSHALSLIEKAREKKNNQIKPKKKSTTPCTNKQEPSKEGK